jgi:alpha-D-ribose 1-methylphosphonate 5-triphosphate synthase subunit PhnH
MKINYSVILDSAEANMVIPIPGDRTIRVLDGWLTATHGAASINTALTLNLKRIDASSSATTLGAFTLVDAATARKDFAAGSSLGTDLRPGSSDTLVLDVASGSAGGAVHLNVTLEYDPYAR